jgi:hypothetical protein
VYQIYKEQLKINNEVMTRMHQHLPTIVLSTFIIFVSIAAVGCQQYDGSPCAFADLNYDRFTDVIAIMVNHFMVAYRGTRYF